MEGTLARTVIMKVAQEKRQISQKTKSLTKNKKDDRDRLKFLLREYADRHWDT